jgi:hypothetical protein
MAVSSGQTLIGTVPVQIDGMSTNPTKLHIHNMDNTRALFIGNGNVSITTGLALQKLDSLKIILNPGESIYAISEIGTHQISWLRQTL